MKKRVCHDKDGNLYESEKDKLVFRPSIYGILIEDGKILLSPQYDGYWRAGSG